MTELRVLFHAHVCPDCASDDITEAEVETGDGITEIALTCNELRHRVAGGLRRGLEHPAMTGQLGVIYLLHFDQPYRHARHYTGWTEDLLDRLDRTPPGTVPAWSRSSGRPGSASPWSASAKAPAATSAPSRTPEARPGTARPAPPGPGTATGHRSPAT